MGRAGALAPESSAQRQSIHVQPAAASPQWHRVVSGRATSHTSYGGHFLTGAWAQADRICRAGQTFASIHRSPRAPQCARPRAPGVRLLNPTLRQVWPRERPGAAMCVQGIDVQCVLQFTLVNAAGCALHRCTSQVIHRSELYFLDSRPPAGPPGCASQDCTVNRTPRRGGQDGAPNRGCSWAAMSDPGDLTGR